MHIFGDQLSHRQATAGYIMMDHPQVTMHLKIVMAQTFFKRLKGWTGIRPIPGNTWLWLKPCSSIHTLSMRESLSLVYLDPLNRVCEVVPEIKPGKLHACRRAASVLEAACLEPEVLSRVIPTLEMEVQQMLRTQTH